MKRGNPADVVLRDEGTIWLFHAVSDAALGWLRDHVERPTTWFDRMIVVEHRYVVALANGMTEAGFTLTME